MLYPTTLEFSSLAVDFRFSIIFEISKIFDFRFSIFNYFRIPPTTDFRLFDFGCYGLSIVRFSDFRENGFQEKRFSGNTIFSYLSLLYGSRVSRLPYKLILRFHPHSTYPFVVPFYLLLPPVPH
jgi:hypothetical protein